MANPTPSQHIDATKRRLVHLSGLKARTADAERRIGAAAEARLAAVSADLALLRPRVNTDPAAAARYQALILEEGQLKRVAAQSLGVLHGND